MGLGDGSSDDSNVGMREGSHDRLDDGSSDGSNEGMLEGSHDGLGDGCSDGEEVGMLEGPMTGSSKAPRRATTWKGPRMAVPSGSQRAHV